MSTRSTLVNRKRDSPGTLSRFFLLKKKVYKVLGTPTLFFLHSIINILIKPPPQVACKTLLLIRLDAIGDYVLFRNFIAIIKQSHRYKDHKITLLGNRAWKDIAENLDGDYISNFIWLDQSKFVNDLLYRYKKLKAITSIHYETVLSPVYSREFEYVDKIVKFTFADNKIGSIGDLSNLKIKQKKTGDKYYTKLLPAVNETMFEFYRNIEFFENLTGEKFRINKPEIILKSKKTDLKIPPQYAILFIGGQGDFKKWSIQKFARLAEYIHTNYGLEIVLSGGSADKANAELFSKYFIHNFIDYVGSTSLMDLLHIIDNGKFMVSNETMAPHLAVALDMSNVFVIYNGNHFGRFTPYPKEISRNYHVIYHPEIEKDLSDYKRLCRRYKYSSILNPDEIKVDTVIKKIKKNIRKYSAAYN